VIKHTRYDHRVDVFSFGIVLWEMLSGQLPYCALSPIQAAAAVVVENLRPPLADAQPADGALPDALTALVSACWDVEPTARPEFQAVGVVIAALCAEEEARVAAAPPARAEDDTAADAGAGGGAEAAQKENGAPQRVRSATLPIPCAPLARLQDVAADAPLQPFGVGAALGGGAGGDGGASLAASAVAAPARGRGRSRGLLNFMGCCTAPGMGKSL
jgi:hypothetical protein